MMVFARPAEHLRGGKLCRADQVERDRDIAERYQSGQPIGAIADAYLLGYVTVWYALRREGVRISMSQVALFREQRKRAA